MKIILDNEQVLHAEIPGINEIDEGSFLEVNKSPDSWQYVVTDNGCEDIELACGTCAPNLRALTVALMNPSE